MKLKALLLAMISAATLAQAADPPFYVKKATWQETMLASRAALQAQEKAEAARGVGPAFTSPVMRGGDAALRVKVPVTGWRDLYLIVDDCGDYHNDVANWADAKLITNYGKETFLDTIEPVSAKQAWGTFKRDNKSTVGGPMAIAKQTFTRGLGTHAASTIHYQLDGPTAFFEASVGVDVSRRQVGEIRFIVSNAPVGSKAASPVAELWLLLTRDFSDAVVQRQMRWEQQDRIWDKGWRDVGELAQRYARVAASPKDASLEAARENYYRAKAIAEAQAELKEFNFDALRLAIDDQMKTFGAKYPNGAKYLQRLAQLQQLLSKLEAGDRLALAFEELKSLQREALLTNPLLDFDKLLVLKRGVSGDATRVMSGEIGQPQNWLTDDAAARQGKFRDELVVLSDLRGAGRMETLYAPQNKETVFAPDLNFDGDKILFSKMSAKEKGLRLWEISVDGKGLRQVTPDDGDDVCHMEPCYLPSGDIMFTSTATYQGLPCVFGSAPMASLYRLDAVTGNIRQLTFEQDSDWCPTVMENGRVLYLRWEYTDQSHANSRMLFHMNPDGTDQRELRGRGSWFPGSFFHARPVPGTAGKVVGIAGGHHDVGRSGRLLIFDTDTGRHDGEGAREIPGRDKPVEPIVRDGLTRGTCPQFLMPYPLSEKYHLAVCKLHPDSLWGIYLVDVFDNFTLIKELPGTALLEPIPLRRTPRPTAIPDRINLASNEATVHIQDIYDGPGLAGVPRGTVKKIRLLDYYFSRRGMGGLYGTLGMDGPWDVKRVLGTVPVEPDGSAYFKIPANTPISLQPIDDKGQALQLMRSWLVGEPGERVSCVGCHESQNAASLRHDASATRRQPSPIEPWHGPARGFSFVREVQPVLDKYCVSCHDGTKAQLRLVGGEMITDWSTMMAGHWGGGGKFTKSYAELHRFMRRAGIEGDRRTLSPLDFHFSQTELGQILRKGHHGVALDAEAWERLAAWQDLNAPFYGTWGEIPQFSKGYGPHSAEHLCKVSERAMELRKKYVPVGPFPDFEAIPATPKYDTTPVIPKEPVRPTEAGLTCDGWPFDAASAIAKQKAAAPNGEIARTFDLGGDVKLEVSRIPGGRFVMGSSDGHLDEAPRSVVEMKPFWMGRFEITNRQLKRFNPQHESREEDRHGYQFGITGYDQDQPDQPAVRVSWEEAMAFCAWLSQKTGLKCSLPTESQWEWACRAGNAQPFWYGSLDTDFAPFANLGDATLAYFSGNPYTQDWKAAWYRNPQNKYDNWVPQDARFNDGGFITEPVGKYKPNAWGLHDMHGNAAEWTLSAYRPYPYRDDDRNSVTLSRDTERVARGGSWYDRPFRCTASFRPPYRQFQRVYNVGFRVICEGAADNRVAQASETKR